MLRLKERSKTEKLVSEFEAEIRQPAEWEIHQACWLAWPSAANLWQENLLAAQSEFTALCKSIYNFGERLKVLVPDAQSEETARKQLQGLEVDFYRIAFGDIWLRDTAPIFMKTLSGSVVASVFRFNGWGSKYDLPHDNRVSIRVAEASSHPIVPHDWILEGGSIESDGEGTILTSKQCLLNPNRNAGMNQIQIEELLKQACGAEKVLWVSEGLINDHTDGHIDTIARFVAPGEVLCMAASGDDDPNREILEKIYSELVEMRDAKGRRLKVHRIPSPGKILNEDGEVMPASYVNFYIANRGVIVPTYGSDYDNAAVQALSGIFTNRKVIGSPAKAILSGGGAFHCITQQEPVSTLTRV
jgi:agmatine deiminase